MVSVAANVSVLHQMIRMPLWSQLMSYARNLTDELFLAKLFVLRRMHISFHYSKRHQHDVVSKQPCSLRMLITSLPLPICAATASSPSAKAFLFSSMIWMDVAHNLSMISRRCWTSFIGKRSTTHLLKAGEPILVNMGRIERLIISRFDLPCRGLEERLSTDGLSVSRRCSHQLLYSNCILMLGGIFSEFVKRVAQAALSNKLKGYASHPIDDIHLRIDMVNCLY